MKRKVFLWGAFAALSIAGLSACSSTTEAPVAKNVIFFLGDGMGLTTMTAARIYKAGEDGELTIDTLPETAFIKTYSNEGETVLDATIGSGTTALAAINTGRKCIGIERDEGYYGIACRRVAEALDKTALLNPIEAQ